MFKKISLKKNGYDYLFSSLIFSIPFSMGIPNIITGALTLIFIITFQKKTFLNFNRSIYLILILLVFLVFFQAILNNSFFSDIDFYKKYLYLLIIPILFLKVKNLQWLKISAILAINLSIVISLYRIIDFYFLFNFIPFGDGWATNYVLLLERPYFGILGIISIILSFEQLILKTRFKYLFLFSLLLSTFFIFFITIRISILTFFVLCFLYVLFYLKVSFKKKAIFTGTIILTFLLLFVVNENLTKRFFVEGNLKNTIDATLKFEPRVVIWDCAYQITKQENFSVLFGTNSYSNLNTSLVDCYSTKVDNHSRKEWFLEIKYNTHSQFIDLFMIGGLGAIVLMLFFFFKAILTNYQNFFSVAIFISLMMMMFIENIFHRQLGCFIFSIFTALYATSKIKQCPS
uniref:O-antigen ligase family protein n=1 Tax=Flavobacterium sp. TaxID=239 RepID=UPI0040498B40